MSRSGRVVDQLIDGVDESPGLNAFTYDNVGRLVSAIPATWQTMSYSFGTASCGDTNAGKNGNRVSKTVNGVATAFCYDNADRLTSIGGVSGTAVTYDTLNRTAGIGTRGFGYNAFNEHATTTTTGQVATLERDSFHRVLRRTAGTGVGSDVWYGYASNGSDAAAYTATITGGTTTVVDVMGSLPGGVGVTRTVSTGVYKYSLPNRHGSLLAVADSAGNKIGSTYKWDPDGMPIAGTTQPDLLTGNLENGWLAQHYRPVDTTDTTMPVIEMGARPYLPSTGRFLTPDPVEDGNSNDYTYPADPINGYDLNGEAVSDFGGGGGFPGSWGIEFADCLDVSLAYCIYHTQLDSFAVVHQYAVSSGGDLFGLNWTNDGCSDRGLVTHGYDLAGCIRHDFGYRNEQAIFESVLSSKAGKMAIDVQLAFDSIEGCLRAGGSRRTCTNHGLTVLNGVAIFGRPVPRKSR